jgi:hypothetical protein
MKCNQWTVGLAAVGLVSLASVARADSTNMVMTALSSTVLSGYVDTSMVWNLGTHNTFDPAPGFAGGAFATEFDPTGHDGFNLDVVDLNLEKDADATDGWGAGYRVELWAGPQANSLATQSGSVVGGDFAVKNAYVELKTPIGNGIDWHIGVFDTIIGYEVADGPNNPNFTRSYGFGVEPTTHTGVTGTYTVNDMISLTAGIANTFGPVINSRANPPEAESYKTWMAAAALTAPKDWGWVAGSTAYACIINGFNANDDGNGTGGANQSSFYTGATLNTPMKELKVGGSFDYVMVGKQADRGITKPIYVYVLGGYATYQATDKFSINVRGEYGSQTETAFGETDNGFLPSDKVVEGTVTFQYDLWKNVLTRVELRWDHDASHFQDFGDGEKVNAYAVMGNVVYKF